MDVYDTIYAVLDANGGKIRGRTTIQKLVYLSVKKIPELDVPEYKAHYFGPFSPGLGWALEKMVSYGSLYESGCPGSLYKGYTYGLTDDGKTMLEEAKKGHDKTFKKIAEVVRTCRNSCELQATPLSYASKIRYLLESEDGRDGMAFSDAVDYAKKLEWKVPPDNVERGAKTLVELELAKPP